MQSFLEIWHQLLGWERRLVRWFAYLLLGRRAVLPALAWQAGGLALVVWVTPDNPLIWGLVYVLSFVYLMLAWVLIRRWI